MSSFAGKKNSARKSTMIWCCPVAAAAGRTLVAKDDGESASAGPSVLMLKASIYSRNFNH